VYILQKQGGRDMKKLKKSILLLITLVFIFAVPLTVSAKTYKAKKVTAQQIVTELSKSFSIKNIKAEPKSSGMYNDDYPN
jgi:hypothetical protein